MFQIPTLHSSDHSLPYRQEASACQSQALTGTRPVGCITGWGAGLISDCQLIFVNERLQKAKFMQS